MTEAKKNKNEELVVDDKESALNDEAVKIDNPYRIKTIKPIKKVKFVLGSFCNKKLISKKNEMNAGKPITKKAKAPGQLFVSDNVISDLIGHTVMSCYGVVGMINPSSAESFENILPKRWLRKGIVVNRHGSNISVDLYIVVEHGTNISAICTNLKDRVAYVSEKYTAIKLDNVNVHVKGIVLK